MPIGPHAAVADVDAKTQRSTIYVQAQALNGHPGEPRRRDQLRHRRHWPTANSPRRLVRGRVARSAAARPVRSTSRRPRSRPRSASRCACSGCAGTSTAGTTTASAQHVRRQDGRRRERQDHRARLAVLRPGRQSNIDTTTELRSGTATWPAVPGSGGPTPSATRLYSYVNTGYGCQAGAREDAAAVRRLVQDATSSGRRTRRSVLRQRADRRRARVRGEHGPDRVPPAEHRRHDDGSAPAGWRCSTRRRMAAGWKPKVAASNLADGQHP